LFHDIHPARRMPGKAQDSDSKEFEELRWDVLEMKIELIANHLTESANIMT